MPRYFIIDLTTDGTGISIKDSLELKGQPSTTDPLDIGEHGSGTSLAASSSPDSMGITSKKNECIICSLATLSPYSEQVTPIKEKLQTFINDKVSPLTSQDKIMIIAHGSSSDNENCYGDAHATHSLCNYAQLADITAAFLPESLLNLPNVKVSLNMCYGGKVPDGSTSFAHKYFDTLVTKYGIHNITLTARTGAVTYDSGHAAIFNESIFVSGKITKYLLEISGLISELQSKITSLAEGDEQRTLLEAKVKNWKELEDKLKNFRSELTDLSRPMTFEKSGKSVLKWTTDATSSHGISETPKPKPMYLEHDKILLDITTKLKAIIKEVDVCISDTNAKNRAIDEELESASSSTTPVPPLPSSSSSSPHRVRSDSTTVSTDKLDLGCLFQ